MQGLSMTSKLLLQIRKYILATYSVKEEHPWASDPDNAIFRDPSSDKWFALYMSVKRKNLALRENASRTPERLGGALDDFVSRRNSGNEKDDTLSRRNSGNADDTVVDVLTLKADPGFIAFMAGQEGILPAYHMNKNHWITVLLDGTVSLEDLKLYIDKSHQLVTDTPTKRIYEAVKKVPKGTVATYQQIAEMAGNPWMMRAVGNALHHNPDPEHVPCYRIVNSQGRLSGAFAFGGPEEQANRLRADGIEVIDGKVDLKKYQFKGTTTKTTDS